MLNKNQNNYILKYNNYQFYENDALNEFLNKQAENGMFFSGFEGSFCNRFKFRYSKKELPKSYIMLHKHLDNQIDQEIEKKKMQNEKIVSEGNRYIVFETVPTKVPDMDADVLIKKQNSLLGVPIKKTISIASILFLFSAIALVLRIILLQRGDFLLNSLTLTICISIFICFLFYFVGDLYDLIKGKAITTNGVVYLSGRTKQKDLLFRLGDIFRWVILVGSVLVSIVVLIITKDVEIGLDILSKWLICSIGFTFWIRLRPSYLSLLMFGALLACFQFG